MLHNKTYHWVKIAGSLAELTFGANGLTEITANEKTLCLALHNGTLLACAQKCPHAGGTLAHGYLDISGNIVCPVHRYKFSLQSGYNVSGEGYFLKTFPVQVLTDGVFVGFEKRNIFNWPK